MSNYVYDPKTDYLKLPLTHEKNFLEQDFPRINEALKGIDKKAKEVDEKSEALKDDIDSLGKKLPDIEEKLKKEYAKLLEAESTARKEGDQALSRILQESITALEELIRAIDFPLATPESPGLVPAGGKAGYIMQLSPETLKLEWVPRFYIGMQDLFPFRISELPFGWYFMGGKFYSDSSAQGQALSNLSSNYKSDWGVTTSGSSICVPNAFTSDGRAYFCRGVDGLTREVGSIQLDAIRNITGSFAVKPGSPVQPSGAFYGIANGGSSNDAGSNFIDRIGFNASKSPNVLVANENRPIDRGYTPAIYLGV